MSRIIGLIGGMSWESTATYYREINELVRARRGGLASADLLLRSVDFEAIVALQKAGRWDLAGAALAEAAPAPAEKAPAAKAATAKAAKAVILEDAVPAKQDKVPSSRARAKAEAPLKTGPVAKGGKSTKKPGGDA